MMGSQCVPQFSAGAFFLTFFQLLVEDNLALMEDCWFMSALCIGLGLLLFLHNQEMMSVATTIKK